MPRPKRKRIVTQPPVMKGFKPFGIPITNLDTVTLLYEEFEAIRLLDHAGLTQAEAALAMEVSRPTLTRIYEKARKTIAEALVEGKAITIEGGDFHTDGYWYRCESCYRLMVSREEITACSDCNSEDIRHLSGDPSPIAEEAVNEQGGFCLCVDCNIRVPHLTGIPCREIRCKKCGKPLIRENSYHHQLYLKTSSMPKMNGTGPEGKGSGTGRGMGKCKSTPDADALKTLGKGLKKKRKTGGGTGRGKRMNTDK
jgi:uncharacterized protein